MLNYPLLDIKLYGNAKKLYFTWKLNFLHPYLSPTSCLDPDVPLNKLVRPGDKLGLSGKSPDVLFPPNSASEPALCTTGKYPNLECFLKYFFDLNLFLSSFVKSRISSPDVVYNEKYILSFIEHRLGHDHIANYISWIYSYRCAVFLHRMSHFMIFVFSSFPSKETILTHVKVKAFKTSITESTDRRLFTNAALGRHMTSWFCCNKSM